MIKLGKIIMYTADDIVATFNVSKDTAYKVLNSPKANAVDLGRKKIISEENLYKLLNSRNIF